jgi:hypothetical protein
VPKGLTDRQSLVMTALGRIAESPDLGGQPTVLIGPSGAGKRTVARATAEAHGMTFSEVPSAVLAHVDLVLADLSSSGRRALLFVPGLESADGAAQALVMRLLRKTAEQDEPIGGTLIVAALTTTHAASPIASELPIAKAFRNRLYLEGPDSGDEIELVGEATIARLAPNVSVSRDAWAVLYGSIVADDCFHTLVRWIETAASELGASQAIGRSQVTSAIASDAAITLGRLRYRGVSVPSADVANWIAQFPTPLRGIASGLVRSLAREYFVNDGAFYKAIQELGERASFSPRRRVAMCRWQSMGKSAPRLANALKNQLGLEVADEINLADPGSWPAIQPGTEIVLVDDIIGSGSTLRRLAVGPNSALTQVAARYPESQVTVVVLIAFEESIRSIQGENGWPASRARIIPWRLMTSQDRLFTDDSRIITGEGSRIRLRSFARHVARKNRYRRPLGFQEMAGLTVFHDTVPNTTLPLIWIRRPGWLPLFPAEGPMGGQQDDRR